MKYVMKKAERRTMYLFIFTGLGLVLMSGHELYNYVQLNQFVYEFPGDWDMPIGIAVGLFLIIRSTKFISKSRELFIKISKDQLVYRSKISDSIHKIALSNIKKIQKKDNEIILITKDSIRLIIVDFKKVSLSDDKMKLITKVLIQLNNDLNPIHRSN
jgi:hypothetical protein